MNGVAALAGNPNCGKTTLFNALTGSHQYVGNWPGVTVEKREAIFDVNDAQITLIRDTANRIDSATQAEGSKWTPKCMNLGSWNQEADATLSKLTIPKHMDMI